MTDQLEPLLRDTFEDLADEAPVAGDLAGTARGRLRRRRRRLAGGTAAAAVVALATTGVLWDGSRPRSSGPAGRVEVTVAPQPPDVPYCPGGGEDCPDARPIAALRQRALHLPTMPADGTCPVTKVREIPQAGGFSGPFQVIGEGPFRMNSDGHVSFQYPPGPDTGYEGTGWGGQKVIWSIDESYDGAVLLRGHQLDGDHQLRFDRYQGALGQDAGVTAHEELAYPALPGAGVARTPPSGIRLQAPGCYAIQADGTSFSTIIVFEATVERS